MQKVCKICSKQKDISEFTLNFHDKTCTKLSKYLKVCKACVYKRSQEQRLCKKKNNAQYAKNTNHYTNSINISNAKTADVVHVTVSAPTNIISATKNL